MDRIDDEVTTQVLDTVTLELTREQAELLRLHADGEAATYTRLVMYPFSRETQTARILAAWEAIYDQLTRKLGA